MGAVKVVRRRPCPELCHEGIIPIYGLTGLQEDEEACLVCRDGFVYELVTCRTCAHFQSAPDRPDAEIGRCLRFNGEQVLPSCGCAAWNSR